MGILFLSLVFKFFFFFGRELARGIQSGCHCYARSDHFSCSLESNGTVAAAAGAQKTRKLKNVGFNRWAANTPRPSFTDGIMASTARFIDGKEKAHAGIFIAECYAQLELSQVPLTQEGSPKANYPVHPIKEGIALFICSQKK